MKKVTAILFAFILFCSDTRAAQLLQIPVLLHHYLEHHDRDHSLSFVGYLANHYSDKSSHSPHHHDHEKLPFKSPGAGFSQTVVIYHSGPAFELKEPFSEIENSQSLLNIIFNASTHLTIIWQPPRISC